MHYYAEPHGLFSNPFSDERAIETAIRKLKNNPDFLLVNALI